MPNASASNREELERIQLAKLRELLAAISPANAFYETKLGQAGVDADIESLDVFRANCPFTTKLELAADHTSHPPYGSNLTYPLNRYTRVHQTSGTRGTPMQWLDTPENWRWMIDNWCHIFRTAGISGDDRIFFAFSFGPFIGFWLAFEAGEALGALSIPGGGLSSAARLRAIYTHEANVLCCTPTYALRLAEVAKVENIDLAKSPVRTIVVAGEPGGSISATRAHIEESWPGARVFDHHGMTEVGPVTYQCPAQAGVLHVLEQDYLAEIIDPETTEPIAIGGTGELVLTTLGRHGSPLIRYRTGDLVTAVESPCACGQLDLALRGGILGRADDMVVVRGVNVYPSAVEEILRGDGGVAEYRVTISRNDALVEMSVEVEPYDSGDNSLAKRLAKAFQESLSLRVPVSLVESGSLPRFELKAKRWVVD
ncbi:MAG: AMP-binding protein [Verrucomicrobiota bacterium]|jgi:phenylacetate-CoA ligase|nr:AMP-binding protein [Verrucomicrobiota bacterium]